MSNGWTPERRARQSALIRQWKPWEKSTGPRSAEGKRRTAGNGYKGGHWLTLRLLSRAMSTLATSRDRRS